MPTVLELVNPLSLAIDLNASLEKAAFLLEKTPFSMLPVVSKGIFVGILERSDIFPNSRFSQKTIRELLSKNMVYLAPNDPAMLAAELLATGLLEFIPVVNETGYFAGIVTPQEIPPAMLAQAKNGVESFFLAPVTLPSALSNGNS